MSLMVTNPAIDIWMEIVMMSPTYLPNLCEPAKCTEETSLQLGVSSLSEGVAAVFALMTATVLQTFNMTAQLCFRQLYLLLLCLCPSEIND